MSSYYASMKILQIQVTEIIRCWSQMNIS